MGRIIYIHGRGFGATHSMGWQSGLVTGLERAGYEVSLAEVEGLSTPISYSAFLDPAVDPADAQRREYARQPPSTVAVDAFVTSGLAGLGGLVGGGMTAGLFVTAGVGAATSLLARSAFGLMSALEAREEIIKIHAEILIHRWEGDDETARQLLGELLGLRKVAAKEARLHASVDEGGPKSDMAKDWAEKERTLSLAIEALS